MKILVVTHSYGLNGAAAILKASMAYWARHLGWQIDAVLTPELLAAHGAELKALGVNPVLEAHVPTDYQLVLINTLIDLPFVKTLAGKLPIVVWIHEGTTVIRNWKGPPATLIDLLSKPDRLIFDCPWQPEAVFRSFIHHLPEERITSVFCGVSVPAMTRAAKDGKATKVVNVGSVYGRKRPLDLARAVVSLAKRYAIRCSFVGNLDASASATLGPAFHDFLKHPSGILQWTGGVSDEEKFSIVQSADIACFPSGDETFGISALEAALLGVPVVLADLAVYNHIGWSHGVNCLKYPVGNTAALETQIARLIDDPAFAKALAERGRSLAGSYTMEKFLDRITAAVASVAVQQPSGPSAQAASPPDDQRGNV